MNIFNSELLPKKEKVLFLDLDILILKPLDVFLNYWNNSDHLIFAPNMGACNTDKTICKYNSSVMLFRTDTKAIKEIYSKFIAKKEYWISKFRGDQDFLGYITGRLPTFHKEWFIKIKHVKNCDYDNIPDSVKILLMNPLKNDAASKKHTWINEYWNIHDTNGGLLNNG